MPEDKFAWSTDEEQESRYHCLYVLVPEVVRQYGGFNIRVDVQKERVDFDMEDDVNYNHKMACLGRIEHLMNIYGIAVTCKE
jgi:hypothetical protein